MNKIEETLLMLFLEKRNSLDLYCRLYDVNHPLTVRELDELDNISNAWLTFKQEELGRTIPEEFEVFVTDRAIDELRNSNNDIMTWLCRKDWALVKQKIKITVVEND